MGTLAERFEGPFVGTAFPLNPVVPPSFPLAQSGVRQILNAGVAELVDALDLGSSVCPYKFKALRTTAQILWVLVRKPPFKRLPLTFTEASEPNNPRPYYLRED